MFYYLHGCLGRSITLLLGTLGTMPIENEVELMCGLSILLSNLNIHEYWELCHLPLKISWENRGEIHTLNKGGVTRDMLQLPNNPLRLSKHTTSMQVGY